MSRKKKVTEVTDEKSEVIKNVETPKETKGTETPKASTKAKDEPVPPSKVSEPKRKKRKFQSTI